MRNGHDKSEWSRTASIVAIIAESNRDKKKRSQPFTSDDFNPYAEKAKPSTEDGFAMLKAAFVPDTTAKKIDTEYNEWLAKIKAGTKI